MALEANAAHFLTDSLGTVLVTLGLIGAWYGLPVPDTIAAIGVAALLSYTSFMVGRRALAMLLDRADPNLSVAVLDSLTSIAEIKSIKTLRIRRLPDHHVIDLVAEVEVSSLAALARLQDDVHHAVSAIVGKAELCAALRPVTLPEIKPDAVTMPVRARAKSQFRICSYEMKERGHSLAPVLVN